MTGWSRRTPRTVLLVALPLATLAVAAATPQLLGDRLAEAWSGLAAASPLWLWAAVGCFLASVLATAFSWRSALAAAGAELDRFDAAARYGVGCLVNTVAPASLGDVARVALISRAIDGPDRLWTAGGAAAAGAAFRGVSLAALVVAASATGALPLWPVPVLCGGAAVAVAVAWIGRRHRPHGRLAHLLAAPAALARSPLAASRVIGWGLLSQTARVFAAAAVATALGVPHPLVAALVIVPTLQLATAFPITPGNVGVASGAVALALQSQGVALSQAIATGLAYHAAETLVGVAFGAAGTVAVVELPPLVRRLAAAGACVAVAACLGATVFTLV